MRRMSIPIAVFTLVAGLSVSPGLAQSTDSGPSLGVARISLTNGDVTTRRGESGDWVAATVNEAVVEGDLVATGSGARTEIQLDYSNLARLASNTEVELSQLQSQQFRIKLFRGRLTYSELHGGEADVDIETPLVAVRPQANGRYEIEVTPNQTVIIARDGEAEVFSPQGVETVKRGKMAVVRAGTDGTAEIRFARAEPASSWDAWNANRDRELADSVSYKYVSRSISGAQQLDQHGDWRYVSGYGNVWYPTTVAAGWAPYRYGRWSYLPHYGWNWVGYEPWGWAPYHYGRWFHHASFGWGWYPGSAFGFHAWRPALVGFFGYNAFTGFQAGFGFGFGNIGWVPLAPGERFCPWYGGFGRGFGGGFGGGGLGVGNRVRIRDSTIIVDNSTNIYNGYRNARVRGGTTMVDSESFSRGLVNNPASLRGEELRRASLMRGQIPVVPARESQGRVVRASSQGARSGGVRQATYSRNGVTSTARTMRPTFAQQREQASQAVTRFNNSRATTGRTVASSGARGNSTRANSGRGGDARSSGVRSASTASGSRVTNRSSGTASVRSTNSLPSTRSTNSRVRSAARSADAGGWRRLGASSIGSGRQARATSTDLNRRAGRTASAPRSGVRTANTVNRAGTRSTVTAPRTSTRVPRAGTSRTRSTSPTATRQSGVRSAGNRSTVTVPRTSTRTASATRRSSPNTRTTMSIPRSSTRVSRASRTANMPTARSRSTGSRSSRSVARTPSVSNFPTRSVGTRSRSYGGGGYSSRGPSVRSTPSMRSSPSRSRGGYSRPSMSGGSRGVSRSSGGGSVRSSGGGSVRSSGGSARSGGGRRR